MKGALLLSLALAVCFFKAEFPAASPRATAQSQPPQGQSAPAFYQKAVALFQQRQYEQSLAALDEALKLDPRLIPALTLKARVAMAANRFDIAKASLSQAVEVGPDVAYNHFLLGFCYYVDNDFKNALPPLERSRQLKPDDARTHFYIALTLEALARVDDAVASYEQSLKLEKDGGAILADTLVAYARLLFTLGRYSESEALIDRALAAAPDSRDAQYEKGRLSFERRAYAEAIVHGKKALELPGAGATERQIHFLLAKAYSKSGQKELAEIHLAKFRAAPPTLRR
ncbi:MAG TPA: tetratricopeptide repeat protein [Blastocatellia bacterium]|nr:tetratricopeptide repeat protein [Blastocatellia bacterium]